MIDHFRMLVVVAGLLLSCKCVAQETPLIRRFEPEAYGAQNQNWAVAQSPQSGWMYVCNNEGLLEFDGARWATYTLPEGQTVRSAAIGRHGEVFCGGFAEFGFWHTGADGRLNYHSLSAGVSSERLDKEEIWHILVDDEFVLFQSFSAIYLFDYQKVSMLQPPGSIMFANFINGRLYVPVIDRGLYELLPDNTFRFVTGTEVLAGKIVQFMVAKNEDTLWIGTANHGLYELSAGACNPWNNPLNRIFQQFQLNKAIALKQGGWVFGTILNGVYVLDPNADLSYHLNRENGLQNNTVLALFQDRHENLWIGLDKGIDLVMLNAPFTVFQDFGGTIGTVYAAVRWNKRLYIGTNQGVFVQKNGLFHLIENTQGQVWDLCVFDGQLLCGHNSGTFRIDDLGAHKISEITGGWCTIRSISSPDQLIQGAYTGLAVFRKDSKGNWRFTHKIPGFIEPLKKIAFDTSGNLWGTHPNKGLFRLRLDEQLADIIEFQTFRRGNGLPSDYRLGLERIGNSLYINVHGRSFRIVDSSGIYLFKEDEALKGQKRLPGSANDFFSINNEKVTMHSGAHKFQVQASLVPDFEKIVSLEDSVYLFCQENGYLMLNQKLIGHHDSAYAVSSAIRFVELAGKQIVPSRAVLNFQAHENNLTFHFAAALFERTPLFSWKMDGYAEDWSDWQRSTHKAFLHLPPGAYVFRLRNDSGGEESSLAFTIAPPWYRTWWVIGLFIVLLLIVAVTIEQMSRWRLAKQQAHLEAEKKSALQQQRVASEKERLSLEVENKNRELNNAALNIIRKNEALQGLRDELLHAGNEPDALQKLARKIDRHLEGEHDWELFQESFNQVHDDFFKRLFEKYPDLTPGDLRLAAYLRMNLSSKEIAPLLNISIRGVENKRYRLRKKLHLPEDANLTEFIMVF